MSDDVHNDAATDHVKELIRKLIGPSENLNQIHPMAPGYWFEHGLHVPFNMYGCIPPQLMSYIKERTKGTSSQADNRRAYAEYCNRRSSIQAAHETASSWTHRRKKMTIDLVAKAREESPMESKGDDVEHNKFVRGLCDERGWNYIQAEWEAGDGMDEFLSQPTSKTACMYDHFVSEIASNNPHLGTRTHVIDYLNDGIMIATHCYYKGFSSLHNNRSGKKPSMQKSNVRHAAAQRLLQPILQALIVRSERMHGRATQTHGQTQSSRPNVTWTMKKKGGGTLCTTDAELRTMRALEIGSQLHNNQMWVPTLPNNLVASRVQPPGGDPERPMTLRDYAHWFVPNMAYLEPARLGGQEKMGICVACAVNGLSFTECVRMFLHAKRCVETNNAQPRVQCVQKRKMGACGDANPRRQKRKKQG